MDGVEDAPLIVSLEGLHLLVENIIFDANAEPNVQLIDPFLELRGCTFCQRRFGKNNLTYGLCPDCFLSLRGSIVIAGRVCSECKGVD